MEYTAIIEESSVGTFGAYVPDLPGCVAVGETYEETVQLINEAIEIHIQGLIEDGDAIPFPRTRSEKVRSDAAGENLAMG